MSSLALSFGRNELDKKVILMALNTIGITMLVIRTLKKSILVIHLCVFCLFLLVLYRFIFVQSRIGLQYSHLTHPD